MSRQFPNVSISPWRINPHTGVTVDTTHSYHTAAPQQRQYSYDRAVPRSSTAQPYVALPRVFAHATADDDQAGDTLDASQASNHPATPETAPEPEQEPIHVPPEETLPVEASVLPTDALLEQPQLEEASDNVAQEAESSVQTEASVPTEDVKDEPPGPSESPDVAACAELAPTPPPPPVDPLPIFEPAVVEVLKSGESELVAHAPPESPVDKFVHFSSDTKDPDAKKKRKLVIGKGKPNAFIRVKDPHVGKATLTVQPPSVPKEEKPKVVHPVSIMKKTERRESLLSTTSIERPVVQADTPTTSIKKASKPVGWEKRRDDKKVKSKSTTKKESGSSVTGSSATADHSDGVEPLTPAVPEVVSDLQAPAEPPFDEHTTCPDSSETLEIPTPANESEQVEDSSPPQPEAPSLTDSQENETEPAEVQPNADEDSTDTASSSSEAATDRASIAASDTSLESGGHPTEASVIEEEPQSETPIPSETPVESEEALDPSIEPTTEPEAQQIDATTTSEEASPVVDALAVELEPVLEQSSASEVEVPNDEGMTVETVVVDGQEGSDAVDDAEGNADPQPDSAATDGGVAVPEQEGGDTAGGAEDNAGSQSDSATTDIDIATPEDPAAAVADEDLAIPNDQTAVVSDKDLVAVPEPTSDSNESKPDDDSVSSPSEHDCSESESKEEVDCAAIDDRSADRHDSCGEGGDDETAPQSTTGDELIATNEPLVEKPLPDQDSTSTAPDTAADTPLPEAPKESVTMAMEEESSSLDVDAIEQDATPAAPITPPSNDVVTDTHTESAGEAIENAPSADDDGEPLVTEKNETDPVTEGLEAETAVLFEQSTTSTAESGDGSTVDAAPVEELTSTAAMDDTTSSGGETSTEEDNVVVENNDHASSEDNHEQKDQEAARDEHAEMSTPEDNDPVEPEAIAMTEPEPEPEATNHEALASDNDVGIVQEVVSSMETAEVEVEGGMSSVQGAEAAQGDEGAVRNDEGAQADEGAAQIDEEAAQHGEEAVQPEEEEVAQPAEGTTQHEEETAAGQNEEMAQDNAGADQIDEGAVQNDKGAAQTDEGAQNEEDAAQSEQGAAQHEGIAEGEKEAPHNDEEATQPVEGSAQNGERPQNDEGAAQNDQGAQDNEVMAQNDEGAIENDEGAQHDEEAQHGEEAVQLEEAVQPDHEETAQPEEEAVQPEAEAAQPEAEAAQPEDEAVQPEDEAVQPEEAVQSEEEAVQPVEVTAPLEEGVQGEEEAAQNDQVLQHNAEAAAAPPKSNDVHNDDTTLINEDDEPEPQPPTSGALESGEDGPGENEYDGTVEAEKVDENGPSQLSNQPPDPLEPDEQALGNHCEAIPEIATTSEPVESEADGQVRGDAELFADDSPVSKSDNSNGFDILASPERITHDVALAIIGLEANKANSVKAMDGEDRMQVASDADACGEEASPSPEETTILSEGVSEEEVGDEQDSSAPGSDSASSVQDSNDDTSTVLSNNDEAEPHEKEAGGDLDASLDSASTELSDPKNEEIEEPMESGEPSTDERADTVPLDPMEPGEGETVSDVVSTPVEAQEQEQADDALEQSSGESNVSAEEHSTGDFEPEDGEVEDNAISQAPPSEAEEMDRDLDASEEQEQDEVDEEQDGESHISTMNSEPLEGEAEDDAISQAPPSESGEMDCDLDTSAEPLPAEIPAEDQTPPESVPEPEQAPDAEEPMPEFEQSLETEMAADQAEGQVADEEENAVEEPEVASESIAAAETEMSPDPDSDSPQESEPEPAEIVEEPEAEAEDLSHEPEPEPAEIAEEPEQEAAEVVEEPEQEAAEVVEEPEPEPAEIVEVPELEPVQEIEPEAAEILQEPEPEVAQLSQEPEAGPDLSQALEAEPVHEPDTTALEVPTRGKQRRRHSHSQRDGKHTSHRRRESEASVKERPTFLGATVAKLSGSPKTKRRDSITEREALREKERVREVEKANSNSDKERAYPEYRSSRYRDSRGEEKHSKRRVLDDEENDAERRRRHEARRAEKERIAAEELARIQAEEEVLRQERRERRRAAKQAEEDLIRAEQERRRAHEERKMAREEEERRIRHEMRRQRHEAEKEARRLELEKIEKLELEVLEAKRLRRQKRTGRERSVTLEPATIAEPIDVPAARREVEVVDDLADARPSTPPLVVDESPRSAPRRRLSTREPPPVKRGRLFGGIFGRSKAEAVTPPRSSRPDARTRIDASERPKPATRTPQKEKERPTSSHHSSSDARHRGDRPRRSRRESNTQRPRRVFETQEEEAEYYRRKELRRLMRPRDNEISGDREVGVTFASQVEEVPPPPLEPSEPEPEFEPTPEPRAVFADESPLIEDSAGVVGVPSASSDDRHERRRSRRSSALEDRPRIRRVSAIEKDKSVVRRVEIEPPRTKDRGDERARTRRGDAERKSGGSSSRKKKEESGGLKGLFGGLKKRIS